MRHCRHNNAWGEKSYHDFLRDVFRTDLKEVCETLKSDPRVLLHPSWLPYWITAEFGFSVCHWCALTTTIWGLSWTLIAVTNGRVPSELYWKPMLLLKLAYPMLPVILLCWGRRYVRCDGISRVTCRAEPMSAGYYFANLKMGLLPSLGPGLLIGVVLDKLVVRPHSFGVAKEYREGILPLAWIVGLSFWLFVEKRLPRHDEQDRCDWGNFASWYIDYTPNTSWETWVKKGPHSIFGIIDAPQHGTFHKVTQANIARVVGVTVSCILFWVVFLLWWVFAMSEEARQSWSNENDRSCTMMLIRTDFVNLFFNTVTAPFLMFWVWRDEKSEKKHVSSGGLQRPLCESAEDDNRIEDVLTELVDVVAHLPLVTVAGNESLSSKLLATESTTESNMFPFRCLVQ
eukprot:TRINITY_DN345_c0_g2_i1.p1 TRINITY_DN345_c0_g2~~TRINITY_DN345_c0_g2_i1.p1  ORF type:complete len:400 (+),score=43.80 TRINITY_DN345_c0_g2_i1:57-1256(+)